MRSLNKITLATAALLASTAFVNAADIFVPETEVEVVPERVVQQSGGWYLRGDIGYAHLGISNVDRTVASVNPADPTSVIYETRNFSQADLDDSWRISGGIGYQVNDYFRVDATIGHIFSADFNGDSSTVGGTPFACANLGVDNATADTLCDIADTTTFSATTLMANAYVDLGTVANFTPYVGAGIGGAYTHWGNLSNDISCDTSGGGDCLDGAGNSYDTFYDSSHGAKNGWRFAYALHAGASYDISEKLKVDAGYSFTHIDGGDMFGFVGGATGTQGNHGDIKVHEVRAGLRYSLY